MNKQEKINISIHKENKGHHQFSDLLDLRLIEIDVGSHGTVWDLTPWLHKGGSDIERRLFSKYIKSGHQSELLPERIELVKKLHERFKTLLALGRSQHYVKALLYNTSRFITWADKYVSAPLSLITTEQAFLEWSEHLWYIANEKKKIKKDVVYHQAASVAGILFHVLPINLKLNSIRSVNNPLIMKTRLRRSRKSARVVDKSNLINVSAFGQFLVYMCRTLTLDSIRGPLPFVIHLPNSIQHQWPLNVSQSVDGYERSYIPAALKARQALHPNQNVSDHFYRAPMANLRIHAELAIFIAQTGMNLQQSLRLQRTNIRWKKDDVEVLAFRVYKNRRQGEALFRAYKEYRNWFNAYLKWVNEIAPNDERLFPFLYNAQVPPIDSRHYSQTFRKLCLKADVPYFSLREIRNVRQNWLLRMTGNPALTADMGAHTKQTLLLKYEKPHHQSATARISTFHRQFDPSLSAGPGLCADPVHIPTPMFNFPPAAPDPDCVSPDGCLFCVHHRDILEFDYVWKLASHAYLKGLERDDYECPVKVIKEPHPADVIIDRIETQLRAFSLFDSDCATWVQEAKSRVWEGRYHPAWSGFIELWEILK